MRKAKLPSRFTNYEDLHEFAVENPHNAHFVLTAVNIGRELARSILNLERRYDMRAPAYITEKAHVLAKLEETYND